MGPEEPFLIFMHCFQKLYVAEVGEVFSMKERVKE